MYSRWYSKEYKEDRRRYRLAKANYSHLSEKFSGLAGYYKRFVKDFPKIVAPLTRLTLKNVKFNWTDRCEEHFQLLKDLLNSTPMLTLHSEKKMKDLQCDLRNLHRPQENEAHLSARRLEFEAKEMDGAVEGF